MIVPETEFTAAEAARRLSVDIETLIELVYQGQLAGTPDQRTGRLRITEAAIGDYLQRHPRQPA